ncbi:hypothetical protein [Mycobacterium sp. E802]|uniref:hypothetical protein n=1 Tax=Mycobacterium sp. E802 TaxID=1834152 RepID=UPI0012FA18AD|nr:hypothetical protein [Mycobacterium sp. E802]
MERTLDVIFDWMAPSATPRAKTTSGQFWLQQNTIPVKAAVVDVSRVAGWDTDLLPALPVAAVKPGTNTLSVPAAATRIRVDIELTVTASRVTKTGLAIRQLFNVGSGVLLAAEHSVETRRWVRSSSGPTRVAAPGASSRRRIAGLHPLLAVTPQGFTVDARFVDLTELWWATHSDRWGRYLHPAMNGRIENLRVLGWTGGDLPTIWFVVLSDLAVKSLRSASVRPAGGPADGGTGHTGPDRRPANIVWLRPAAGMNSFAYAPTVGGFESARHDDTTWYNLSRWLLSPVPKDKLSAVSSLPLFEQVLDQMQRTTGSSSRPVADAMANVWSHRPVGLERILSRTGRADIVLLPLCADTVAGFDAATRAGLKPRVDAAIRLLWSTTAAGTSDNFPITEGRSLWAAAHSGANHALAATIHANGEELERVISHEASGPTKPLDAVVAAMNKVSARRKSPKQPLDAVFVVTPHMTGNAAGLTPAVRAVIDATGARIRYLPDPAEAADFWRIPPVAKSPTKAAGTLGTHSATEMIEDSSSPFMRYFFENFTEREMFAEKPPITLRNFRVWVVHEMAVFAGHLDPLPASAPPDPPRTIRTLLEDSFAPF